MAPNPKGALALLRRLESLVGVTVDATELEDAATEYEQQVSRAVELDPDVQAFVERLERAADEDSGRPDPGSLPSATCSRASSSASCASAASVAACRGARRCPSRWSCPELHSTEEGGVPRVRATACR